ncbi:MAG TPA: PDZ domain-containing protein [Gemmatimonadaceae bacterium]|jgi:C-terminal processing protease CtpA/Prc|nr:PDZ domain-containing protein [Gemmatimonadaceae bacterium]
MSDAGDPRRFVIHEVLANGPAAAAGLATGDRIVSVDSVPVAQLTLGQLRNILRSQRGGPSISRSSAMGKRCGAPCISFGWYDRSV